MTEPIVSVIIPTYNREKLILKALNSIFAQTFQGFEVIIVDDASTDNTEKIIHDLQNEKIRYIKLERNGGQCIARNIGIKAAKGNYIAFLDSDDEWMPGKLEKQLSCFNNGSKELGCVYGFAYQTDVLKNSTTLASKDFQRGNIRDKFLNGFCPPTPSLFMIKKDALLKVGGFDESLITFVDLDLWLRLSENYYFDYVEEPLIVKYEQIGDQYINNFEKRYKGFSIFQKKWAEEIKKLKGKDGLLLFNRRLVHSLVIPFLEHPPINIRRNILKIIRILFHVRSTRLRLYIKALMIFLFGPNIINLIRKTIHNN
jgi:glycosyltransferase involved in cell wall biosynthesis